MKHVGFLRGINVGGKNKLPMKVLVEMFTNAGCRDVHPERQRGVQRACPSVEKAAADNFSEDC